MSTEIPAAFMAAMRELPATQLEAIVAAGVALRKEELRSGRDGVLTAITRDAMVARFDMAQSAQPQLTFYQNTWQSLYGIDTELAAAVWRAVYSVPIPTPEPRVSTPPLDLTMPEPTPITTFAGAKVVPSVDDWGLSDTCTALGMTVKDVESAIALGCLKATGRREDKQMNKRDVAKFVYQHPDAVHVKAENAPILEELSSMTKRLHRTCGVCGSSAEAA